MIPEFVDGQLPPGEHAATWDEITARFGTTPHRRSLLEGLRRACASLSGRLRHPLAQRQLRHRQGLAQRLRRPAGNPTAWTSAPSTLSCSLAHPRTAQKDRYGGELFPNAGELTSGSLFVDFFQTDRDTGLPKGIIVLDLRSFVS